jgi:hypothetical protein
MIPSPPPKVCWRSRHVHMSAILFILVHALFNFSSFLHLVSIVMF